MLSPARFASVGLERVGRGLSSEESQAAFRLGVQLKPGESRQVSIGADLLGPGYDFTRSTAFPLFVIESLRWLANLQPPMSFATAGEYLPGDDQLAIGGASYTPPRMGSYAIGSEREVEVSLGPWGGGSDDAVPVVDAGGGGSRWGGIVTWSLLVALGLLFVDWGLYQKGRVP